MQKCERLERILIFRNDRKIPTLRKSVVTSIHGNSTRTMTRFAQRPQRQH